MAKEQTIVIHNQSMIMYKKNPDICYHCTNPDIKKNQLHAAKI